MYVLLGTQCVEFLPSMNDWIGIDLVDPFQNSIAKFLPGLHPNVTQKRARHLPEERLDYVEPGAMRGRQHVFEPVRPRCQITRVSLWRCGPNGCRGQAGCCNRPDSNH